MQFLFSGFQIDNAGIFKNVIIMNVLNMKMYYNDYAALKLPTWLLLTLVSMNQSDISKKMPIIMN